MAWIHNYCITKGNFEHEKNNTFLQENVLCYLAFAMVKNDPDSSVADNSKYLFHAHVMATHSTVLAWRIPGTGSLMGCRTWGRTELDMTEAT